MRNNIKADEMNVFKAAAQVDGSQENEKYKRDVNSYNFKKCKFLNRLKRGCYSFYARF